MVITISMLARSISLILSVFILSQSFNIHLVDVLKLSNLLEHIAFHESAYGDDIFAFFSKHYGDKMREHEGQQDTSRDHQKLPFHHNFSIDFGQFFLVEVSLERLVFSVSADAERNFFDYDNFYSFLENKDIFQPPRIA